MVLEATVICVDNSEWMRNGDYAPTRIEAQHDAVNLICGAKTQQNAENTVAIMTGAGRVEVLVTLTTDLGKVLTSLHSVKMTGKMSLLNSLQIAQLVLKHRLNKNQRQRIVIFVGSPIDSDEGELVKLGKKLKKNNVAVDVINFGEEADNTPKLEAFVNAVNSKDGNSRLVTIPPGPHILSDILLASPIIHEDGAPPGMGGTGGFEFGVDPTVDPDLAFALRISLEEERARQEAVRRAEGGGDAAPAPRESTDVVMGGGDDEQALLAQALAMSMGGADGSGPMDFNDEAALTEEEQIRLAMQMSMAEEADSTQSSATQSRVGSASVGNSAADLNSAMQDPAFLNSVLGSLPGVDPNDERIRDALNRLGKKEGDDKDGKEGDGSARK
eukprot:Opistho-2@83891